MAWPDMKTKGKEAAPTAEEYFTPQAKIKKTTKLKIACYGKPETGKSFFGMTGPPPIYVIDLEFAAAKLAQQHFPNKDIRIFEASVIDPVTNEPDPIRTMKQIEAAIVSLKKVTEGTIVIDPISSYWECVRAWMEKEAKRRTASGQPYRFEYAMCNKRHEYFMMRLLSLPVHVIMTSRVRGVYSEKGEETGMIAPRWQGQIPHIVDIVIRMGKHFVKGGGAKYLSVLEKSRIMRAHNKTVEDLTFNKLVKALKEIGIKNLPELAPE